MSRTLRRPIEQQGAMQQHLHLQVRLGVQAVPGIIESSPGVRSCMIEYDQRVLPLAKLLDTLESIDRELPSVSQPRAKHMTLHESGKFCPKNV